MNVYIVYTQVFFLIIHVCMCLCACVYVYILIYTVHTNILCKQTFILDVINSV